MNPMHPSWHNEHRIENSRIEIRRMGLGSYVIEAGATAEFEARNERTDFRPTMLIFSKKVARHFSIASIAIGNREQLAGTKPIPLLLFYKDPMTFDTLYVGGVIKVCVRSNLKQVSRRLDLALDGAMAFS